MPLYRWKGIQETGIAIKGMDEISSIESLKDSLYSKNIALLSCKEISPYTSFLYFKSNPPKDLKTISKFFGGLALLINNGVELVKALETLAELPHHRSSKKLCLNLALAIRKGESLHNAMCQYPDVFSHFIISIIAASENTGTLGTSLEQLYAHLKQKSILTQHLKNAAYAPLVTLTIAGSLTSVIIVFILPHFKTLYESLNKPLPQATVLLFKLHSIFTTREGIAMIALIFFSLGIIKMMLRKSAGIQKIVQRCLLSMPIISNVIINAHQIIFMQTIELFLKTGLPLTSALEQTQTIVQNVSFKTDLHTTLRSIQEGYSFSKALEMVHSPFLDKQLIALIHVGEQSGNLASVLHNAALQYHIRLTQQLEAITTLLTPLFMIIVGLMIGGLMIIMYLPIFNLGNLF